MSPTFNPALYGIKRLEIGERIEHFDCGDEDLNDFILNDAPLYRRSLLAAIPFYEKNGFRPLNGDDRDSTYTRLLYFDLNELNKF